MALSVWLLNNVLWLDLFQSKENINKTPFTREKILDSKRYQDARQTSFFLQYPMALGISNTYSLNTGPIPICIIAIFVTVVESLLRYDIVYRLSVNNTPSIANMVQTTRHHSQYYQGLVQFLWSEAMMPARRVSCWAKKGICSYYLPSKKNNTKCFQGRFTASEPTGKPFSYLHAFLAFLLFAEK